MFQYLFCLLNAFHGFWIFLVYAIREPSVRQHWQQFLCCKYGILARKYTHTVSSGVFSSSGNNSNNQKYVVADNLKSTNNNRSQRGNSQEEVPEDKDCCNETNLTALSPRLSSASETNSEGDEMTSTQEHSEPLYENWSNLFLEQKSVTINMNTGIPYQSSLPRNKKGFGLEGLYNDAYQNFDFNTSSV